MEEKEEASAFGAFAAMMDDDKEEQSPQNVSFGHDDQNELNLSFGFNNHEEYKQVKPQPAA